MIIYTGLLDKQDVKQDQQVLYVGVDVKNQRENMNPKKGRKVKKKMVQCDGCEEMFDASDYDNITSRHPHYNLKLDKGLSDRIKEKYGIKK